MRKEGPTNVTATNVAPSPRARTQPRYIASCAASGPGASWARARPSLYSSGVIQPRCSTRSCCMCPASAIGPPKPSVPSFRK